MPIGSAVDLTSASEALVRGRQRAALMPEAETATDGARIAEILTRLVESLFLGHMRRRALFCCLLDGK